jgi:uncharacterized repeat protein (TIGR02543 family)
MKKKNFLYVFCLLLFLTNYDVSAQVSMKGQVYFKTNQNLRLPVTFFGDVGITVAEGFTVRAPKSVKGNGYTMTKKGSGMFWFQAHNPLFDSDIVYAGKPGSIYLSGTFGPYVDAKTGHLYLGSITSSNDMTSPFFIDQKDTVVQTLNASSYTTANTNLYIEKKSGSTLRIINSANTLSGKIFSGKGGTLYMDGALNAHVKVTENGLFITGNNSTAKDYASFGSSSAFNDSTITVSHSTMKIGDYAGPSLLRVRSGNVINEGKSTVEIDVYNPATNWGLSPNIHSDWNFPNSFSDKIYLEKGNYVFKAPTVMDVTWDPAYSASIAGREVFYLPVIMLQSAASQHITGGELVELKQTLPGWRIEFAIGDGGANGPVQGWGYIKGSKIMMQKNASIDGDSDNGTHANPVSVLGSEHIKYELVVYNPTQTTGEMRIVDTLPPYLKYAGNATHSASITSVGNAPVRDVLTWEINKARPNDTLRLSYEAIPENGACASQPLFVNKAYITANDRVTVITNSTYHQGAGTSILSFAATRGGQIYYAEPQALDYKSTPREGVKVVTDDGYLFAGWSHKAYSSLRGMRIAAKAGIMEYDTITIYGDIEFVANFEPVEYPIYYYLNESENSEKNPASYTVEDSTVILAASHKPGDEFIGWTGSNGNTPQQNVVIPQGTTGELTFYANFRQSGKEEPEKETVTEEKVWAADDNLYITTRQTGATANVYTTEGILLLQKTIASETTVIKLQSGIYVVSLNGGFGHKIIIK